MKVNDLYLDLLQIEEALLAALLFDRDDDKWELVPELNALSREDFIGARNGWVFQTVKVLHDESLRHNFWTVAYWLHRLHPKDYEALGDKWFIAIAENYRDQALSFAHVRQWVKDIQGASYERLLAKQRGDLRVTNMQPKGIGKGGVNV